jgi:hypothetical protein
MKKPILETIQDAVREAKNFPDTACPVIEYNFELPEVAGVTPDEFFGMKAIYNKKLANIRGYQITYKF